MRMEKQTFHTPVLLNEALEYLDVKEGERYIDATVGGGGHSAAIVTNGGAVLGLDWDPEAVEFVRRSFAAKSQIPNDKFQITQGNFREIDRIAYEYGFKNVAGVLFDLGISSHHLEASGRGFSFRKDEPLDLRMDPELEVRGMDLVNGLTQSELEELFKIYGEEPLSRKIAEEISKCRTTRKITTTRELRGIVEDVGGSGKSLARVWQALRIAVNDEINALKEALPKAIGLLKPGGRIVVISFHSLEDRVVKREFRRQKAENRLRILTPKPVMASEQEIRKNPRASSAKMRVGEKT